MRHQSQLKPLAICLPARTSDSPAGATGALPCGVGIRPRRAALRRANPVPGIPWWSMSVRVPEPPSTPGTICVTPLRFPCSRLAKLFCVQLPASWSRGFAESTRLANGSSCGRVVATARRTLRHHAHTTPNLLAFPQWKKLALYLLIRNNVLAVQKKSVLWAFSNFDRNLTNLVRFFLDVSRAQAHHPQTA